MFYKSAVFLLFGWLVLDTITKLFGMPIDGIYWVFSRRYAMSTYVVNDWESDSLGISLTFLAVFTITWIANIYRNQNTVRARAFTIFVLIGCTVVPLLASDTQNIKINYWWSYSMLYCAVVFFLTLWKEKEWLDLMRRRIDSRRRW